MTPENKIAVVTGAAGGIGKALAQRLLQDGAKTVIISDLEGSGLDATAREIGAVPFFCDVTREDQVQKLVSFCEETYGPIDIFCSNAGILRVGDEDQPDGDFDLSWQVNAMAHVYAARAVAPGMAARGSGYLMQTASAAGVLIQVDSAAYTMSKHAAIGFAEFLAAKYGPKGIGISVLCPMGVRTAMTSGREDRPASADGMLEPEEVAEAAITAMRDGTFLVFPHEIVGEYMQRKASDRNRWLRGMARVRENLFGA
ncbi:SDR family oxidoreductase [Rhodovibrionaceae bacterium A322]